MRFPASVWYFKRSFGNVDIFIQKVILIDLVLESQFYLFSDNNCFIFQNIKHLINFFFLNLDINICLIVATCI